MKPLKNLLNLYSQAQTKSQSLPELLLQARRLSAALLSGHHHRRKAGSGEKFWQFRDYDPADPPASIDWRQSAKGDRVFIRQREQQNAQTHIFWVSKAPGMAYRSRKTLPTKGESANILALTLAMILQRQGELVGAANHAFGRSEQALINIARHLIDQNIPPLDARLNLRKNSNLILAGDFLDDISAIQSSLAPIMRRHRQGLIVQCLDPAELELPFEGNAIFDPEDQNIGRIRINHVGSLRTAYQNRLRDHCDKIEEICRRAGWKYVLHRTDEAYHDTLMCVLSRWQS